MSDAWDFGEREHEDGSPLDRGSCQYWGCDQTAIAVVLVDPKRKGFGGYKALCGKHRDLNKVKNGIQSDTS